MPSLFFDRALLPAGWAEAVRVEVDEGTIAAVRAGAEAGEAEAFEGVALPGLPNLHAHSFQRGMAGLAERRGPAGDSFWTWRDVMYRFLGHLTPDDVEAIAAFAFLEMLEGGFTACCEFHYLHHGPDGTPYADPAELSARVAAAAAEAGIGLTLLPVFYAQGGFGGAPPGAGQRRFVNDPERFLRLVEGASRALDALPDARLGVAPHSLRAVTPEGLRAVLAGAPDGPVHVHAAEQTGEVEACVAWSGRRPVAWLLDEAGVDGRWCVVHATHMTPEETRSLARSGAVAGLCPLTEANLGDGIFPGRAYLEAGGAFGVGSDSNIEITAAGELKTLEYGQRLRDRARNVMATAEGESTGRRLYEEALKGGARAAGRRLGRIAPGHRADIVVLDGAHPDLAALEGDRVLDAYVFVAGKAAIDAVIVGGTPLVRGGRHRGREAIVRRYGTTIARLAAG